MDGWSAQAFLAWAAGGVSEFLPCPRARARNQCRACGREPRRVRYIWAGRSDRKNFSRARAPLAPGRKTELLENWVKKMEADAMVGFFFSFLFPARSIARLRGSFRGWSIHSSDTGRGAGRRPLWEQPRLVGSFASEVEGKGREGFASLRLTRASQQASKQASKN